MPKYAVSSFSINLGPLTTFVKAFVSNLGVKIDQSYKFVKQMSPVVKASFFHCRLLKFSVSRQHFEILIHAFVTTRPDYCDGSEMLQHVF